MSVNWKKHDDVWVPQPLFTVEEGSLTCHICGNTSHHPQDIEHRYCGYCHAFWGLWTDQPLHLQAAHIERVRSEQTIKPCPAPQPSAEQESED